MSSWNSLGLFTQGTRKTHGADQPRIDADDSQESRKAGNKDRATGGPDRIQQNEFETNALKNLCILSETSVISVFSVL
ncbi:MAG: hypothetical protein DMF32_06865 [Verrucomicrobia bacterium]|nr:MAG: hypothetical protein DMF32_06865 [Verrucomicrobiota bacterium]